MKDTFTPEELNFLSNKGLFLEIARLVPSPRPQKQGATVSPYYVQQVLRGKTETISDTTQAIQNHARTLLNALFISSKTQNI